MVLSSAQQQRVFGLRGLGLGRAVGARGGAAVASAAAKGGSANFSGGQVGRRGVMAQGLSLTATALVVAALTGGYVGWRGIAGSRGGPQALAATLQDGDGRAKRTTSSLGFSLAMTREQVDDAVKDLTDLQRKVTMNVSSPDAARRRTAPI